MTDTETWNSVSPSLRLSLITPALGSTISLSDESMSDSPCDPNARLSAAEVHGEGRRNRRIGAGDEALGADRTRSCVDCGRRPREVISSGLCRPCWRRTRRAALYAQPCSYEAAHARVRRARGNANEWRCARCGEVAEQWAYLGDSPREIRGRREWIKNGRRRVSELAWSPDPADYSALCRICHGRTTDDRYGRGARRDPASNAAYQRTWYAALKADPIRYAAYLDRKRANAAASRANPPQPR